MPNPVDADRRRFLEPAAVALAAAPFTMASAADASEGSSQPVTMNTSQTSFSSIEQIDAGDLNIGYAQAGPATGKPVILLHGWPYDIHSYVDVAPLLAAKGYRVTVPYLRGFGSTRFLSDSTMRNGQPSALASDVVALMDALEIRRAILGGFDWGARTANIVAALWP